MELYVFKMHTHFFYKFKMLLNFNAAPNFTPGTNVVFSNMYNISLIVIRYDYLYKYTAYL